ncbi:MAG: polysaccharide deacetylase family protein [Candidatus Korobacteraceae bacterium]
MPSLKWLFALILLLALSLHSQTKTIAERLGYPADAKLLILHADDLAVAHSVDTASFDSLNHGAVTSASIMVPCSWLTEVADYAKTHPDADLGLHLTLTSEWKTYRWGSVAPNDDVSSLLDPAETFWFTSEQVAAKADPEEAESEIRAQIERALAVGIHPTHLDSHMGSLFSTPELFAVYVKVAHEYHLPFLVIKVGDARSAFLNLLSPDDVIIDAVVIAGENVRPDQTKSFYLDAIKNLKPGITEMIVHLGHDDAELQAIMVDHDAFGAAWRQRDFDIVNSDEFKKALRDNHIVLAKWKDLQKLVNSH